MNYDIDMYTYFSIYAVFLKYNVLIINVNTIYIKNTNNNIRWFNSMLHKIYYMVLYEKLCLTKFIRIHKFHIYISLNIMYTTIFCTSRRFLFFCKRMKKIFERKIIDLIDVEHLVYIYLMKFCTYICMY